MIAVMMIAALAANAAKILNNFHIKNISRIVYTRGVFLLYRQRREKRRFIRVKRFLIMLLLTAIAVLVICEHQLDDFRPVYIRKQAEILSMNTVCDAVEDSLERLNYSYSDLAVVRYSDVGDVQAIETDTLKINKMKSMISKQVEDDIEVIRDNEVKIPLGAFTYITVLSNYGPEIPVNFSIVGAVNSEIISTFESAGINQTIHHIKLIVTTKIMTTSLDYSGDIVFTTDFELAQTVIIGTVPNYYGKLQSLIN